MIAPLVLLLQGLTLQAPSYAGTASFDRCVEGGVERWSPSALTVDQVALKVLEGCRLEWRELRSVANRTLPLTASPTDTERALSAFEDRVEKRVRERVVEARARNTR